MLKVSVITVCFNSAETIGRTIASVNAQTYGNIEHIVIDGGSTDETLKIIFKHKKCKGPVQSEPDRGIYDAMNKGMERATGDVVCFLNSDDEYASTTLIADVVNEMHCKGLDVVYGDVVYVSPEGKEVRHYSSQGFSPLKLKYGFMPAHPSLFVRSSVYRDVGGFKPHFKIAGDFEMCCRLFSRIGLKYDYLERPFVKMLTGGASAFSFASAARVNHEIREACRLNGIKTNYIKLCSRYFKKFWELKARFY